MSIDNPELYFQTKLFTGNGGTQSITLDGSENMQPDLVWIKNRATTGNHALFNVISGVTKYLNSNTNYSEQTSAPTLTSFNSDGFTVGSSTDLNGSGNGICSWNWKAGGSASSNTDGSITSTVSANTTAGFSIVSYTGTNSGITVGHGLGSVPSMIIFKDRSNAQDWVVNHKSLAQQTQAHLTLNTTNASGNNTSLFNNTAPTSSVFSVGANVATNASSANFIAYCFAEKKGYSKFGSYTGNGNADGTFVPLPFKASMIIYKNSSSAGGHWQIHDNKRSPFNVADEVLRANLSNAETEDGDESIDILSNGFKPRGTSNNNNNHSGDTYVYIAFSESPFVNSKGVPTTAR
mgnify:CR=1 FL=1